MKPKLLIRADAGLAQGTGHVMRMIALAEAWKEVGGGAARVLGRLPPPVAARAQAAELEVVPLDCAEGTGADAEATRDAAASAGAAWVVADGYSFPEPWQRVVRSASKLLIVDDNGENSSYLADCVLNHNAHASEEMYRRRAAECRLMLGPRFALMRSEFRHATTSSIARPLSAQATRLLVTMGGADPCDVTGRFLDAVTRCAHEFEVEVLVGAANPRLTQYQALVSRSARPIELSVSPADVTRSMARADLALSAAGGTVWELALMGVPAVVLSLADNQLPVAAALQKLGAVLSLGDGRQLTEPDRWLEALTELARDQVRRAALVQRARSLVDGAGALRVARALQKGTFDA